MRERAFENHAVWKEIAPEITPAELHYPYVMDVEFLRLLSRVRRRSGVVFRFVSDARSAAANKDVHGAEHSAHMEVPCAAVDVHLLNDAERYHLIVACVDEGVERFGIYPAASDGSGSFHIDDSRANPRGVVWTHA